MARFKLKSLNKDDIKSLYDGISMDRIMQNKVQKEIQKLKDIQKWKTKITIMK